MLSPGINWHKVSEQVLSAIIVKQAFSFVGRELKVGFCKEEVWVPYVQ